MSSRCNFSCISIGISLGTNLGGIPSLFNIFAPLELVPGVAVVFCGTDVLLVHLLGLVCLQPPAAVQYFYWLIASQRLLE